MQLNIRTPESVEEITALRTLFEEYLKNAYWSEKALSTAFEGLLKAVSSPDIVRTLTRHTVNARIHSDRIERIFQSIGIPCEAKKFDAIASLLAESDNVISGIAPGAVRDAAVIALVQHILHCEIASYGTLKSFALTLKEEEVVTLLEKSLEEEKEFDLKLSVIAEAYVNDEAANSEI
jgi:ferritin-like metal-binding protein YciE